MNVAFADSSYKIHNNTMSPPQTQAMQQETNTTSSPKHHSMEHYSIIADLQHAFNEYSSLHIQEYHVQSHLPPPSYFFKS